MSINTNDHQGNITKRIRVYTNDPQKKVDALTVKAFIKTSISISRKYISLAGKFDDEITKTVTIIAKEDKPLELKPNHFTLKTKVSYRIEEVKKGQEFKIHFTRIPGFAGTHHGFLKLKTNYPEKPEISIKLTATYLKKTIQKKSGQYQKLSRP